MSVGTILVSLNDVDRSKEILEITAALADRHDAHVIGLYVIPAVYIHPGISAHVTADVIDWGRKFFQDRADGVKKLFDAEMKKQGFKGEWRQVDGISHLVATSVVEHGRQSDLIVVSQGGKNSNNGCEADFAERIVLDAGRPVLLIPNAGTFDTVAQNVIFGWNATRESARAAFDAVPLLKDGAKAHVMWVDSDLDAGDGAALPGAELAVALSRHGVEAISEPSTTANIDAADALLNRVSDAGADMLVMGAYGHSRVRELVFGGATRKVLDQMTVPVLMSH
ncbi:MAG: universal stress protein [Alphaproteobacteria bacterium]|nr:universal stress protein [Alphaproteobacteria bacterium]